MENPLWSSEATLFMIVATEGVLVGRSYMRYLLRCACDEVPHYRGPVRVGCP